MRGVRSSRSCVSDPRPCPGGCRGAGGDGLGRGSRSRGREGVRAPGCGRRARAPGRSRGAGFPSCQAPVPTEAPPLGVEATQVSGNGSKVLSLGCGFGIQDFVRYIWDIPDVCSNALVSKGVAAFELFFGAYGFRRIVFPFDLTARVAFSIPSILQQLSLKAPCH